MSVRMDESTDVAQQRDETTGGSTPAGREGRRSLLLVAILVVAVVVGVTLWRSGDGPEHQATATKDPAATPPDHDVVGLVADASGRGNDTGEIFEVTSNWELRWTRDGQGPFEIELLTESGVSRGVVVRGEDRPQGSTFLSETGRLRLKVTASDPWTTKVVAPGQAEE
jgi:hypothetical protein